MTKNGKIIQQHLENLTDETSLGIETILKSSIENEFSD